MAVIAVVVAATLWAVLGGGQARLVWNAMKSAQWPWLALGAALMVCYTCVEAFQISVSLKAMGHQIPYRHCCQFAAAGFYFSSITPSSSGGQPAEVFYMARRGVPAAHGALVMLLFTIFYQVTSVGYGLAAWLLTPEIPASLGTGLGVLLGYGLTTMLLLTVGMTALLVWPKPVERLCRWCLGLGIRLKIVKDLPKTEAGLKTQMEKYAQGTGIIKRQPLLAVKLLGASALQQGTRYLITWTVYQAMGLTALNPFRLVATQALVNLAVGCLPIPGAVGASEAAFLAAFHQIFGEALTSTAMLLTRGLSFYLPLLATGAATAVLHLQTRPKTAPQTAKTS